MKNKEEIVDILKNGGCSNIKVDDNSISFDRAFKANLDGQNVSVKQSYQLNNIGNDSNFLSIDNLADTMAMICDDVERHISGLGHDSGEIETDKIRFAFSSNYSVGVDIEMLSNLKNGFDSSSLSENSDRNVLFHQVFELPQADKNLEELLIYLGGKPITEQDIWEECRYVDYYEDIGADKVYDTLVSSRLQDKINELFI